MQTDALNLELHLIPQILGKSSPDPSQHPGCDNDRRDNDLRGTEFFDTAKYPRITFKSKRVEPGTGAAFKLIGDLTIRNTTKEVALDVEAPAPVTKGMKGFVTGTTATTKIKRLEYGLRYNSMVEAGPVVGDEVTITIDIEIARPTPPGTAH